jgi:hypothetical protein
MSDAGWSVVLWDKRIVWACLLTIPAAGLIAAGCLLPIQLLRG